MTGHWKYWLGIGVVAIAGGFLTFLDPLRNLALQIEGVSVAIEYMIGWLFVLVGCATTLLGLYLHRRMKWRVLPIGSAILAAGVFILVDPAGGGRMITLFLAVALMVSGGFKAILGWELHPGHATWWIVGSGIISFAAGLSIVTGFHATSNLELSLFLGIDMIATGAMMFALAFHYLFHRL